MIGNYCIVIVMILSLVGFSRIVCNNRNSEIDESLRRNSLATEQECNPKTDFCQNKQSNPKQTDKRFYNKIIILLIFDKNFFHIFLSQVFTL